MLFMVLVINANDIWGDVDHYWVNISEVLVEHRMPYSETKFEYPPLALVIFAIPRLVSWDLNSFRFAFAFFSAFTYLVSMLYTFRIADRLGISHIRVFLIFFASVLWLNQFILARYDIFPVAMIFIAIDAYLSGRHNLALIIIGLATMLKVYPSLILFAFLYPFIAQKQWKKAILCFVIPVLICVLVMVPFMAYDMASAFDWVSYHSNRGIQVESVIGSILEVGSYLSPGSVVMINNYGSDNLTGTIPDAIAGCMNYVMATSMLAVLLLMVYAALKKYHTAPELERSVVMISLILILTFIIFNKVYSAQYGLWVILFTPLLYLRTNSLGLNDTITVIVHTFGWLTLIAALSYKLSIKLWGVYKILSFLPAVELLKNIATVVLFILVLKLFWDQFKVYETDADTSDHL